MYIELPKSTGFVDWSNIVESSKWLMPPHEAYGSSTSKIYSSAIFHVDGFKYGRLLWRGSRSAIEVDIGIKYYKDVYLGVLEVAKNLGGCVYYKKNEIFDPNKHLPILRIEINSDTKYFDHQNLEHIKWIAIREINSDAILSALKLSKSKEIYLQEKFGSDVFIITPTYSGWTFLIGDNLPNLLIKGDESSSDEALTNLCKSLQKLSKKFIEVQYFEHQGKSNITGYFKANNGKLNFGYWKSETEEFVKGRVPKEIKELHPTSAHEVASAWSIDPLDFIYLKEMAEEKSIVVVPI